MSLRIGLRSRFLLATLGLTTIVVGVFTFAIHQGLEVLELELGQRLFSKDFETFVAHYQANPSTVPALDKGFEAFIVRDNLFVAVPPALQTVPSGLHAEYPIGGKEYSLGRRDLGNVSLFLLLDSEFEPVERLEHRSLEIALLAGGVAIVIATVLALWLTRIVLGPVRNLAENARKIVPGAPRPSLVDESGDREIATIARAFDRTLDGFDSLVERERDFTRDASHELRTPLAVILTSLELLESGPSLSSPQQVHLGRVRSAAEQMRALVEGLLFLARPAEQSAASLLAVSDVLREAVRIQTLARSPQSVVIELRIEQEHFVETPRGLLFCLVNNLLRNALEHGGGRVDMTLTPAALIIKDEGLGTGTAMPDDVFAKHVRGPHSDGEGLGLYIVKRICDRLGWRIGVENLGGGGTQFSLDFNMDERA